jgi:nicotinamidase-related amidase
MSTAFVILDMLNDFVDGTLANPAAKAIIEPIGAIAEVARAKDDWLVVYGNDAHQPADFELKVFGEHAMAGTHGAAVIDPLEPATGDIVVPKRYYSAFTQTDLDATFRVHRVERVVLAGQHTDCCCRHTAYDAFQRGLEVAIVDDATAVYQPLTDEPLESRQHAALTYLRTYYGAEVLNSRHLV